MIFDDMASQPAAVPVLAPASVAAMLVACAAEAARMAACLERLDHALSGLVPASGSAASALQEIDLLRQEGAGLASVLQLIAADPNPTRQLDPAAITAALAVWAQSERLHRSAHATGE